MDGLPRLKHQGELRRLMGYLRPYAPLLAGGIFLMMAMGAIEFLTAFSIRPALDVVLNPQSTAQKLTLFQIPWNGHTVV
jgi:ABC-type multidrug transport system fused ATPase/permease subunit